MSSFDSHNAEVKREVELFGMLRHKVKQLLSVCPIDVEMYAVLWSQSEKAFRVEMIEDMLMANAEALSMDWPAPDYIPLFFCETRETAGELCAILKQMDKAEE